MLDGACRVDRLVDKASEMGFKSLAITDHGAMFGAINFYRVARAKDIKPIIGCEVYVAPGSRHEKKSGARGKEAYYHLVLLVKDETGYQNLVRLATAAQLVGAAQGMLDAAVAYAKQRSQFGTVIGTYQAIKHKLADVLIAVELARPLVYGAALSLADSSPDTARDVSAAKVAAADAALMSARSALQTHGAIGFTAEHDLSLQLLRVQALRPAWGDPTWHRRRVLEAL